MIKNECLALIDRLASKELSLGCEIELVVYEIKGEPNPERHRLFIAEGYGDGFYKTVGGGSLSVSMVRNEDIFKILGHDVLIGDCLEKMAKQKPSRNLAGEDLPYPPGEDTHCLIAAWSDCGFTKSLQEIAKASGFEDTCESCKRSKDETPSIEQQECAYGATNQLRNPDARKLFTFLDEIFPKQS